MKTYNLEETKQQALLKFTELCKEPDDWIINDNGELIFARNRNFEFDFGYGMLSVKCGEIEILRTMVKNNKYYKLTQNLVDYDRCKRLEIAMKVPYPLPPGFIETVPELTKPSLWSKFKTWMSP